MTLRLRRKVFVSFLLLFFLFVALLLPFVGHFSHHILRKSLQAKIQAIIAPLKQANSREELVQILQNRQECIFQRVSLFDASGILLFDPHQKMWPVQREDLNTILEALAFGVGYQESFSPIFQACFSYVAVSFQAHQNSYILRLGVPFDEIRMIVKDLKMGFLLLSILSLSLYSLLSWGILHHLSRPFQKIIHAIRPYQEGKLEFLPHITPDPPFATDEFGALALTLNALNQQIRTHIQTLVHQRKETEEILQSLGEGVIALDAKTSIIFANHTAAALFGIEQPRFLGANFMAFQKEALSSNRAELFNTCYEMILHTLQTSEMRKDLWTSEDKHVLQLCTYPRAGYNGVTLVLQDKTADYKMLEMGKHFIANASHELKTPITVLLGFSEMLQEEKLSKAQTLLVLKKITKMCQRLDKLVKGLLTLANLEHFKDADFEVAEVLPLLKGCKQLMLAAYPDVQIKIIASQKHLRAKINSTLLDLAVTNLLENAIKYSNPGAPIHIYLEEKPDHISLKIEDHGIGIPESDLPYIFHRFYTVDKARSHKSGGAGLGLSIVSSSVEKLQGKIEASSILGEGSLFEILLQKT